MPTMDEIRTEWKAIRSALGNIICYLDGKTAQLGDAEQAWQKGYDAGHRDGYKNGWSDCVDCEGKQPKEKTNGDKFLEVFPGVDSLDKLVTVLKTDIGNGIVQSDWWSEPYVEVDNE